MAPMRTLVEGLAWKQLSTSSCGASSRNWLRRTLRKQVRKGSVQDLQPLTDIINFKDEQKNNDVRFIQEETRGRAEPETESLTLSVSDADAHVCRQEKKTAKKVRNTVNVQSDMTSLVLAGPRKSSRRKSVDAVKGAFCTLRQHLRTTTRRRRKRLFESPCHPYTAGVTPKSTGARRSARLAEHSIAMYSPFCIDTPTRTPNRIRMGVHEPKRFNFSSPGQFHRDLDNVATGISSLTNMADNVNGIIDKPSTVTRIRTTPGGRTPTRRRTTTHVFV